VTCKRASHSHMQSNLPWLAPGAMFQEALSCSGGRHDMCGGLHLWVSSGAGVCVDVLLRLMLFGWVLQALWFSGVSGLGYLLIASVRRERGACCPG
jgi:hypothetical protein